MIDNNQSSSDEQHLRRMRRLRSRVQAAKEEFQLAAAFHETWKPMAYDGELHRRVGPSLASYTFKCIGIALRREMLLALMRLWDTNDQAVRLKKLGDALRDKRVIATLVADLRAKIVSNDVDLPDFLRKIRYHLQRCSER